MQSPDHPSLRIMKKPAAFLLLALTLGLNIGCEQQSYEESKMFNQSAKPGGHGHDAAAEHDANKPAAAGHEEKKH